MIKLTLIAAGALAALAVGAPQANAQEYGYGGYADETGACDQFTIAGAHVGATLFGFNAGVGGHFGFGNGECGGQGGGYYAPQGYGYAPPAPPAYDPYPAAYPQAPWGAPYAYRGYAPPPPPQPQPMYGQPGPCGCERYGW